MTIWLKKFGSVLTSRSEGREAFFAYQPTLRSIVEKEEIVLDFVGVVSLSPGWADEFITPLDKRYGNRLRMNPTNNASVELTLRVLKLRIASSSSVINKTPGA